MKNPLTILVADDDDFNLEVLVSVVKSLGHEPVIAKDGSQALEKIVALGDDIDIYILDRMMPGMNGDEVVKKAKFELGRKDVPAIIQSGKAEKELFLSSFNSGAMFYVEKPYSFEEMEAFINIAVNMVNKREKLQQLLNNSLPADNGEYKFQSIDSLYEIAARIAQLASNKLDVANALSEIMTNSLEHGSLQIGQAQKSELLANGEYPESFKKKLASSNKDIIIELQKTNNMVNVKIKDQGDGFAYQEYQDFNYENITKLCGRGIFEAKKSLQLNYIGNGNQVLCSFARHGDITNY